MSNDTKQIEKIVMTIEDIVTQYGRQLEPIQKNLYKKALVLLKDISVDASGNIKQTVENYKLISKVKNLFKSELSSDKYLRQIAMVNKHFAEITQIQQAYFFSMFKSFKPSAVMKEIQKQAVLATVDSLTEAGINEVLINKATKIITKNIQSGNSFAEMTEELEKFIKGNDKVDGKLVSYSKQIITDAMTQYSGQLNKIITDDLGLQWYEFAGGLMRDSRPMCRELVKKTYIHKSEITGICNGIVDGKEVSTQGFIDGTDKDNFIVYRCGYNCQHLVVPISEEFVPKEIREKINGSEPIEPKNEPAKN